MQQAPVQIYPGRPGTVIWSFDGTYLGPTLEVNIGERLVIRMHTHLGPGITSIIHPHRAHVASESDGSALWSQQIYPGQFRDYVYHDDDIAATHWSHDHEVDFTGHDVFMGLEGCFLLHDPVELGLDLLGRILSDKRSGRS